MYYLSCVIFTLTLQCLLNTKSVGTTKCATDQCIQYVQKG